MAGGAIDKGWKKLRRMMKGFDKKIHQSARKALSQAGEELASNIRTRILDGTDMPALHAFTIEQKGSSKPLIDDGDLLGSVGVHFIEDLTAVVGVYRKAEDGTNIAELHEREDGTRIPVTKKMRAFLHARGLHLKAETTELFIPARPFMSPAYKDFRDSKQPEKIAMEMVKEVLGVES